MVNWTRQWTGLVGLLALATSAAIAANQQDGLEGYWRSPAGSVVQIYGCGSEVCLRIAQVEKDAPGTVDENNPDPKLRSRSLCGLEIGSGFHPNESGAAAEDGSLYDPKSGKTYTGSMALDGSNRLKLRGYVGVKLLGRTEEWTRVDGPVSGCQA